MFDVHLSNASWQVQILFTGDSGFTGNTGLAEPAGIPVEPEPCFHVILCLRPDILTTFHLVVTAIRNGARRTATDALPTDTIGKKHAIGMVIPVGAERCRRRELPNHGTQPHSLSLGSDQSIA